MPIFAVLALVMCFALWPRDRDEGRGPAAPVQAAEEEEAGTTPGDELAAPQGQAPSDERVVLQSDPAAAERGTSPPSEAGPAPLVPVRGRVLDVQGGPLVGVRVRLEGAGVSDPSDGSGAFVLEIPADHRALESGGEIETADPAHVTLCHSLLDGSSRDREHIIVAAPRLVLAGRVTDDADLALAGARVAIEYEGYIRDFPVPLDRNVRRRVETRSDEEGRFRLDDAPAIRGGVVTASKEGYQSGGAELPTVSREDLILILAEEQAQAELVLEGLVLLPDRQPAPGAKVHFDSASTKTDEAGRFRLAYDPEETFEEATALVAARVGYGPAVVRDFGAVMNASRPSGPAAQELVLAEDLSISGRVLDVHGQPLRGWRLALLDGAALSRWQIPITTVENLALGPSFPVSSAVDGSFTLSGLEDREYRVHAWDPDSLVRIESGPVAAGTRDLELRVPPDAVHPRVAGRVVTRTGVPVAKARVQVGLATVRAEYGFSTDSGAEAWTDDDGRFELTDVPRDPDGRVHLDIHSDNVLPEKYWFDDEQPVEDLVLSVAARCHYQVEVAADASVEEGLVLHMLDEAGNPLNIYQLHGQGWSSMNNQQLIRGTNGIRVVSEDARTLRLTRGVTHESELVSERPVVLTPGTVTPIPIRD